MFGKLIGNVVSKIVGEGAGVAIVEYFDKKQQLKQELKLAKLEGKVSLEKAKAQYRLKELEQHGTWQRMMIENSGWKDEFVLVLISIPLALVFIPWAQGYVLSGFEVLDQTPEWYRWMIVTLFAAVYGIKPSVNIWRKKTKS